MNQIRCVDGIRPVEGYKPHVIAEHVIDRNRSARVQNGGYRNTPLKVEKPKDPTKDKTGKCVYVFVEGKLYRFTSVNEATKKYHWVASVAYKCRMNRVDRWFMYSEEYKSQDPDNLVIPRTTRRQRKW